MRKIRALWDFKVLSLKYECTILITKLPWGKPRSVSSTPKGEASCSPVSQLSKLAFPRCDICLIRQNITRRLWCRAHGHQNWNINKMAKIAVIITFQTSYNDLMMKHGEVYIQKTRQYIFLFFVCFYYTNNNKR